MRLPALGQNTHKNYLNSKRRNPEEKAGVKSNVGSSQKPAQRQLGRWASNDAQRAEMCCYSHPQTDSKQAFKLVRYYRKQARNYYTRNTHHF